MSSSPFIRVNAGRCSVEGTGIGLSLSKALAELMKGSLGFTSRPDHGSDFWVELPEAEPPAVAPNLPPKPAGDQLTSPPKLGALVLYIEDNRANADLMTAIVDHLEGVRLQVARTGTAGLMLAGAERPDIVFLDQHLPDMLGLEVLRRLRLEASTRRTPVVVISADVALAAEHGPFSEAQAFLTKPLDVSAVVSAIDQAMRPLGPDRTPTPSAGGAPELQVAGAASGGTAPRSLKPSQVDQAR